MPSSEQKSVVTVRISGSMKASLQQAADEKGGNLSAEILHRLAEHESLRDFTNRLLDDGVVVAAAAAMKSLRESAAATSSPIPEDEPLERAVITATCLSQLFATVANHANEARARKFMVWALESQKGKDDVGETATKEDASNQDATTEASGALTDIAASTMGYAKQLGERTAFQIGATMGPIIWDICFSKDSPLRSTASGMGSGLVGNLSVGLPPAFMTPSQNEEFRLASMERLKAEGMFRDAAKKQVSAGLHSGKSEDEVADMLYDDFLKSFGMKPGKEAPDVATG